MEERRKEFQAHFDRIVKFTLILKRGGKPAFRMKRDQALIKRRQISTLKILYIELNISLTLQLKVWQILGEFQICQRHLNCNPLVQI